MKFILVHLLLSAYQIHALYVMNAVSHFPYDRTLNWNPIFIKMGIVCRKSPKFKSRDTKSDTTKHIPVKTVKNTEHTWFPWFSCSTLFLEKLSHYFPWWRPPLDYSSLIAIIYWCNILLIQLSFFLLLTLFSSHAWNIHLCNCPLE